MNGNIVDIIIYSILGLIALGIIGWIVYTLIKYNPVEIFVQRWRELKWVAKEVGKTLSNEPSFLSSKRIERFIFVVVYVTLTMFWVWHRRNEMSAAEFLMVVAPLMVYAGFNTTQIRIDKKADANTILADKAVDKTSDAVNKIIDQNENK